MQSFKPIPGFQNYEINRSGTVARIATLRGNPVRRVLRWVFNNGEHDHYAFVTLSKNGKCEKRYVHHLVAETFIGKRPAGHEVNHKDCNTRNNFVRNLEYVTPEQNRQHSAANGQRALRYRKYINSEKHRQRVKALRSKRAA